MTNHLKALATCVLVSAMANAHAQTTAASGTPDKAAQRTTASRTHKKAAVKRPSVESQIQQLRQEMEQQIQQWHCHNEATQAGDPKTICRRDCRYVS